MGDKRFYREGRKVLDSEKSGSNGPIYCTARSNHAAEVIAQALNSWHGFGPTRTTSLTDADYAQLRRLNAVIKKRHGTVATEAEFVQTTKGR
jgi:hypothetical protein